MDLEAIEEIIKENPDITYQEAKREALQAGVDLESFNQAWEDIHLAKHKAGKKRAFAYIYTFFLLIVALAGLDAGFWNFVLKPEDPNFIATMNIVGFIAVGILTLHLAARLAGGQGSIFTTTKLSILLFGLAFGTQLINHTSMLIYVFSLFAGALVLMIILYIIMRAYKIGIIRTIILIVLQAVFMGGVIQITYGLMNFKQLIL